MSPGKLVARLAALVSGNDRKSGGTSAAAAATAKALEKSPSLVNGASTVTPEDETRAKLLAVRAELAAAKESLAVAEADLAKASKVVAALTRRHYLDLPLPPEALRLHVGKSTSPFNFWAQGMGSSTRVLEVFGAEPTEPILDWGCGSGRTLRWLLAYPNWREHYRGCDVDADAIAWLQAARPAAASYEVARCGDDPPLPYPDHAFRGVFAFSVLTHIHPDRHRAWYAELRRILKPGGLAYLTTLGPATLDERRKQIHSTTGHELATQGFTYLKNEGHYKDGAIVSEAFTRKALDGIFSVEEYVANGYGNMDAFRVRPIG